PRRGAAGTGARASRPIMPRPGRFAPRRLRDRSLAAGDHGRGGEGRDQEEEAEEETDEEPVAVRVPESLVVLAEGRRRDPVLIDLPEKAEERENAGDESRTREKEPQPGFVVSHGPSYPARESPRPLPFSTPADPARPRLLE